MNSVQLPGQLSIEELQVGVVRLVRRSQAWSNDIGVDLDNPAALRRLLVENPINAWTSGKGTGSIAYFSYEKGVLKFSLSVEDKQREHFQEWIREIADWRLAEYVNRPKKWDDEEIVCKVMHSGGRPILKLPDGCDEREEPWGWHRVIADDNSYKANFVRLYVNVLRDETTGQNRLSNLMREWFGEDAGKPGTRYQVVFTKREDHYILIPFAQSAQFLATN